MGFNNTNIILASSSLTRHHLLEKAGVPHLVEVPRVDEEEIKRSMRSEGARGIEIAEVLAEAKAVSVSRKHRGEITLGADQILECDDTIFDKPRDRREAEHQLKLLRGKPHKLISYAIIARDSVRLWGGVETATLTVRANASDEFIGDYITAVGKDILSSVGSYQIESLGVQLFSKIEGSHFTILGLPLLSVLDYLRDNGVLKI